MPQLSLARFDIKPPPKLTRSKIRQSYPGTDEAGNQEPGDDGRRAPSPREQQPQHEHEDPDGDAADEGRSRALERRHGSGPRAAGQRIVHAGSAALEVLLHETRVIAV